MMDITLKELNDSLTPEKIIQLVTELGSDEYIDKGDYIIFKTICHNEDAAAASMKLYYYKKNKKFHCYTDCGDNFNIFTLFERRYKLLGIQYNFYKDIVLKITDGINIKKTAENGFIQKYESKYGEYKIDKPDVKFNEINQNILKLFTFFPTPEWLEDGISEEVMKLYNILYSIEQNKIIIPHYDISGNLIGIRGRALNESDLLIGKYMPIQIEKNIYSHPLMYNLYGLNLVKENIQKYKMAIVAESEKSPMQYATMFGMDKNICTACCGSSFHKYQLDLLISCGAERVLIAFDKEGKTRQEQEKYFIKLQNICNKYKNFCQMGFIYDSFNLLNLKDSPFDKGPEIAKKLINQGVWIK